MILGKMEIDIVLDVAQWNVCSPGLFRIIILFRIYLITMCTEGSCPANLLLSISNVSLSSY